MESGAIEHEEIPGPIDLQATLESGQTFLWRRLDGKTYTEPAPAGGSAWYRTVHEGEVVDVRQADTALEWRSTTDAVPILTRRLRLDDDLREIVAAMPDEPVLEAAVNRYPGLRVVDEPFFGTLVSFIISAQMYVKRIHGLVSSIRTEYGEAVPVPAGFEASSTAEMAHAFPDPATLADVGEEALRDLGLGYRAPYVEATAAMVADDEVPPDEIRGLPYEAARDRTTEFVGVGNKVADCVLLFSLGFVEPVPMDTWIRTAIEEHFPSADRGSYAETSRAMRERLGPNPGYAQTYVFHHLRTATDETVVAED